jgi:hypothetical protein
LPWKPGKIEQAEAIEQDGVFCRNAPAAGG